MPEPSTIPDVSVFPISQATRATFTELYFKYTCLIFIQVGSKRVLCPVNGEMIGNTDEVMVFPPGAIVTLENRPVLNNGYLAIGVCFSHPMVKAVFPTKKRGAQPFGIQILQLGSDPVLKILDSVQNTLKDEDLPESIRQHRLLEPLIWLKHHGVQLAPHEDENPLSKVRRLIETDLSHSWRSSEVAEYFSISESTMRRWLAKSGQGFAKT
ncbi:MAG: AraC family transcriptional regulator, partial [Cyanobacteria bacterium P01_F01_bin.153]